MLAMIPSSIIVLVITVVAIMISAVAASVLTRLIIEVVADSSVAVPLIVHLVRLANLTELGGMRKLLAHVLHPVLAQHVLVVAVVLVMLTRTVTAVHLPLTMLLFRVVARLLVLQLFGNTRIVGTIIALIVAVLTLTTLLFTVTRAIIVAAVVTIATIAFFHDFRV